MRDPLAAHVDMRGSSSHPGEATNRSSGARSTCILHVLARSHHDEPVTVGVNLGNRGALIVAEYGLPDLLDLAVRAGARGFDSVWVGDSLFSEPRWDPIVLLSAVATRRVRLGTACLVVSQRHSPTWRSGAMLDARSGGRTMLGACTGNARARVRAEFTALGLPYAGRFELWFSGYRAVGSVEHFIVRFAARDRFAQLERFAGEVLSYLT